MLCASVTQKLSPSKHFHGSLTIGEAFGLNQIDHGGLRAAIIPIFSCAMFHLVIAPGEAA